MTAQETATSAITSVAASTAGLLAALILAAVIGVGAEYVTNLLTVELPFRQFMLGRNWSALTVQRRFVWIVIAGCIAAVLGRAARDRVSVLPPAPRRIPASPPSADGASAG